MGDAANLARRAAKGQEAPARSSKVQVVARSSLVSVLGVGWVAAVALANSHLFAFRRALVVFLSMFAT